MVKVLTRALFASGSKGDPVVIYGYPTTGKTYLIEQLRNREYLAADTDTVMGQLVSTDGPERKLQILKYALAEYPIVVTNLIDELDQLGVEPHYAFIRDDTELVFKLMCDRDPNHGLSYQTVERWTNGIVSKTERFGYKHVNVLKEGEYISDYLDM